MRLVHFQGPSEGEQGTGVGEGCVIPVGICMLCPQETDQPGNQVREAST